MTSERVAVELVDGPLDGRREAVELRPNVSVWLFRVKDGAGVLCQVHAYRWADRSTADGKRWVLSFLNTVGRTGESR